VAALLAACYHFPAWLLHDAFLDYPLIAIVSLAFALLIWADDFRNTKRALAFGVAVGLGALTKQTFPFFFALPAIYVGIQVMRKRDRRAIVNLVLSGLLALSIAAIWYLPHLDDVIAIYRVNRVGAVNESEPPAFSVASMAFYWWQLLNSQLQIPFALLFVGGLVHSIKNLRRESAMLYLWIASGILCFTFIANKDVRYTVPVLPAVALISLSWLNNSRARGATEEESRTSARNRFARMSKRAIAIAAAAWAIVSFINAQWPMDGFGLKLNLRAP
jgi:4-amino-4-deoxy-L-arabinose transferase-like glycosyltransferase